MTKKRTFTIEFQASVEIEIDDRVINLALTEAWRKTFYTLNTAAEVASHIAYNMVVNGITLEQMDGFADLDKNTAKIVVQPEWEVTATKEG